ncbi:MAG: homocysteine S-methyltransferase family protein [Proteobacteria bacterium]|nr:homocysteine S-methyltransferase family protein [Pseudomonadota bacterium]
MTTRTPTSPGLLERLAEGPVICAEGYLFEFERRGYLQAGAFVPELVIEHPDMVRQLHRDFVHAGSDVVEAFTYYGHREKLKVIGKEELLEPLNKGALAIAQEVADESGALLAGNICNTNVWEADRSETHAAARAMFEEQVGWAVEAGVDFIIGETFSWLAEALAALETIKAADVPAVITFAVGNGGTLHGDVDPVEACARLADAGADVVGFNCVRGPATMVALVEQVRSRVSCHVAALPVPYRTTEDAPTFFAFNDPACDVLPADGTFPAALDPFACNRYEMGAFARRVYDKGVHYLGVCCGAGPHHIRAVAEALGRTPPASRYSPDMSKHAYRGTDPKIPEAYRRFGHQGE